MSSITTIALPASYYSSFKPEQSSYWRYMRNLTSSVVYDVWNSLGATFSKVRISESITLGKSCEKIQSQNPNLESMYSQLVHKRKLTQSSMLAYGEVLAQRTPGFKMISSFLFNLEIDRSSSLIFEGINNSKLLAIPIILNGTLGAHIVVILFDVESNCIEFYDPKGLTIKDRSRHTLVSDTSCTLQRALELVLHSCGNSSTRVTENPHKHQYDTHNCGVYVCDYLSRRCSGETAEDIFKNGKSFKEIDNSVRERIVREIFSKM